MLYIYDKYCLNWTSFEVKYKQISPHVNFFSPNNNILQLATFRKQQVLLESFGVLTW